MAMAMALYHIKGNSSADRQVPRFFFDKLVLWAMASAAVMFMVYLQLGMEMVYLQLGKVMVYLQPGKVMIYLQLGKWDNGLLAAG